MVSAGYWSVDAKAETAMGGVWKKGPGLDLFTSLDQVSVLWKQSTPRCPGQALGQALNFSVYGVSLTTMLKPLLVLQDLPIMQSILCAALRSLGCDMHASHADIMEKRWSFRTCP